MLVRNLLLKEKDAILELGRKIFREEDEIPLLRKALSLCSLDLSFVAIDTVTIRTAEATATTVTATNILGFTLVCSKSPTNYYAEFMRRIPNCYELAFIGIHPNGQGKGLGTRLLKETLLAIFQSSAKPFTCWLLVDTINEGAIKLYEKIGFRRWCKTLPPITPIPGYIMGIHSRRLIKSQYKPPSYVLCNKPQIHSVLA
jgi:ribosomal protein S18 acetylase RimI-like enzyme